MQREITQRVPLLDAKGNVAHPGYARKSYWVYDRLDVHASALRIKEWDYYCVMAPDFGLAITVADNGYMGLDSITLFDFVKKTEVTKSFMQAFPMGKKKLPFSSLKGDVLVKTKTYTLSLTHVGNARLLEVFVKNFKDGQSLTARIKLSEEPRDSLVIATPFEKKHHFYYNHKITGYRATGEITLGSTVLRFEPINAFAVLDWGRGVWTYANTWYWANAAGMQGSHLIGLNLGYGFGDTSAATENMIFVDGIGHKLTDVSFEIPKDEQGNEHYLEPWRFTSSDLRLTLDFYPILDRSSKTKVLFLQSDQHQVFGEFSGTLVLDDGTSLTIHHLRGFAEKVMNRW
jgi:hypothetical protein